MKERTNFFKIFITSIYDLDAFIKYAKEGLLKGIIYILILCIALGALKGGVLGYRIVNEIFYISDYIKDNKNSNILNKDGELEIGSNISNIDNRVYLDDTLTINNETELENLFNNNDLLVLKDGIAFNNYGDIHILNYNKISKDLYIDEGITGNTKNKIITSVLLRLILMNIIDMVKTLVINYIIVVIAGLLISIFMRMLVKYKALWLIVMYSSTLPLIIVTIFNILKPNIDFNITFIAGCLTYVIILLKYIKSQIIANITKQKS